eukprot:tig00021326_g20266.t1
MPVMDGLTATREIRRAEAEAEASSANGGAGAGRVRTPVVALTAHALLETRASCLEAGMDCYMTKPLNRAALLDAVARFTARRRRGEAIEPEGFGQGPADLHSLRALDGPPRPRPRRPPPRPAATAEAGAQPARR